MTTTQSSEDALRQMREDPDIRAELATTLTHTEEDKAVENNDDDNNNNDDDSVPALNVINFSHRPNAATKKLLEDVGGIKKIQEFTDRFYRYAFEDPRVDQFIREHDAHHGKRFAAWIAEKFGDSSLPWSQDRATREVCPFSAHGYRLQSAHDRSSAHFAAWHSPKRSSADWGEHFNLADCRVWMRLHFLAARETGVLETPFGQYYVKFIGHFVSVYERTAPAFARESARWSADSQNVVKYLETKQMPDVTNVSYAQALASLPETEREYTGSGAEHKKWPYGK